MQKNEHHPYTLGLDIGIASVGAALMTDNRFLGLFVRTFDKAETADKGESLNKIRRDARLTRRRIRRRAQRLLRLCRLMKREGLIESATPDAFQNPERSPWELRAAGLDEKLSPKEWASVLYHLVKHRGFLSNRKADAADEQMGKMLAGIRDNQPCIRQYRTVGEAYFKDELFREAKRNKGGEYKRTIARKDLETELQTLFAAQRSLGNPHTGQAFEKTVCHLLMHRRPVLSGNALLEMVGSCTFEPQEKRAPKAGYLAQRFVWLTKLNNLRITERGKTRSLTEAERSILLERPFTQAKLTYQQVKKALELAPNATFNGISYASRAGKEKDPETAVFFEAKAFHVLRKAYADAQLKTAWDRDRLNPARLENLAYAATCFKDDDEARKHLQEKGVEADVIEAVLPVSFDQFIALSQKALQKIVPFMEQGMRYDEAVQAAGYAHHSQPVEQAKTRYLPKPDKNLIRNPVVYRALNQSRKLINAIVRQYGPPRAVHIELARDLSRPFDERQKIERQQKDFQKEKEHIRQQYEETHRRTLNNRDLLKARLYHEQDGQCAYTQKPIDINRLFEVGYAEIDHALPYSRSFDDSLNNKVLVLTAENRNKGNRTPYEYLDGKNGSEKWRYFQAWVLGNKKIRKAKQNRLLKEDFSDAAQNFRDRNLNDTRYISRLLKDMLENYLQWDSNSDKQNRCVTVNGQLTALLRARWGLPKVREEGDLHHAQDAAVVAACSRAFVKRMADYARRKELEQVKNSFADPETGEILNPTEWQRLHENFPMPWQHFRTELKARLSPNPAACTPPTSYTETEWQAVKPVRVSRAPTRRGLGAAHQETIRSIGRDGKWLKQGQSAIKTPLATLKKSDLENILGGERDTMLLNAITARMAAFGYDAAKAFARPLYKTPDGEPDAAGKAPLIRSVKVLATQKSGLPVRGGIANNGNMLRVDIFTKGKRFFAVPVYVSDVTRKTLPNRAVTRDKPENEWDVMDESYTFLFTLYPNDWLEVRQKNEVKEGYFAGLDRSTGNINLWTHDRDQRIGKAGLIRGIGIKTALSLTKYHVDLLGNLHRVRQETRPPLPAPGKKR